MIRVAAVFPHNEIGTDRSAVVDYARGIEALGVSSLVVVDHVLGADPNRPGGFHHRINKDVAFHEPLTLLSFIAALTTRVTLVTGVVILPQRQTALVAKQAAEIALLSEGRLRLGVGIGWNEVEYRGMNVPFTDRGKRQEEQVTLLRRLWSEDAFSYHSNFHSIDAAGINPRPSAPIPIWFGGSSLTALNRCARLGDGWIPLGRPDEATAAQLATIRGARAMAGRADNAFSILPMTPYGDGNHDEWRSDARRWKALGVDEIAVVTHDAGPTDVASHLRRLAAYQDAVASPHGAIAE